MKDISSRFKYPFLPSQLFSICNILHIILPFQFKWLLKTRIRAAWVPTSSCTNTSVSNTAASTLWSSLSDKAPSLCLATYFPNSLKKATFYFSCNRKYMRFSKEASARTNTPPRAGSSPPADSPPTPAAASHLAGPSSKPYAESPEAESLLFAAFLPQRPKRGAAAAATSPRARPPPRGRREGTAAPHTAHGGGARARQVGDRLREPARRCQHPLSFPSPPRQGAHSLLPGRPRPARLQAAGPGPARPRPRC